MTKGQGGGVRPKRRSEFSRAGVERCSQERAARTRIQQYWAQDLREALARRYGWRGRDLEEGGGMGRAPVQESVKPGMFSGFDPDDTVGSW